jgi:hypothetical protein
MNAKLFCCSSVVIAALALVILITNLFMATSVRSLQSDVSQRQAVINNGVTLNQLNQGLIQALADAAVNNNDLAIRDLLVSQGISITPKQKQGADAAPAAGSSAPSAAMAGPGAPIAMPQAQKAK